MTENWKRIKSILRLGTLIWHTDGPKTKFMDATVSLLTGQIIGIRVKVYLDYLGTNTGPGFFQNVCATELSKKDRET